MVTGTIPDQEASIFPHRFFLDFNVGSMTNIASSGLFPGNGMGTQALMSPKCGVEDQPHDHDFLHFWQVQFSYKL
jgi:hypothetical protein